MTLVRRAFLQGSAVTIAVPLLPANAALADAKRQALVDDSLEAARKVLNDKEYPDAVRLMGRSKAVLIVPQLVQGGFIFGAAGGRGTLLVRSNPGSWSYPAFYTMGSGSIGLQIGGKVSEIVFIILTEKGLHALLESKFKFGAEAGVTLVAVGTTVEGATTTAVGADIVAYARSTGLFAGASLEGSYLDPDHDWNAMYYGRGANPRTIALERRFTNPGAERLRQFLARW
ncbi:MAG TPA: lipid-binding SYLF domain-containing protein [Reyranellaceae bacterium]|nr:lipid-binding SYLF domain-containing protein [Reyranellaceae bacterium]